MVWTKDPKDWCDAYKRYHDRILAYARKYYHENKNKISMYNHKYWMEVRKFHFHKRDRFSVIFKQFIKKHNIRPSLKKPKRKVTKRDPEKDFILNLN